MINPDILTPEEVLLFQKIILNLINQTNFDQKEKEVLLKAIDFLSNNHYIS
jgi:hypothetical protein